jgi:hypothetical protein
MEGKKPDAQFEQDKRYVEDSNYREKINHFVSKFSEKLSENPIKEYVQHKSDEFPKEQGSLNKVTSIRFDESGTGGSMGIEFGSYNYINVDTSGTRGGGVFEKNADYYKVSQNSFHDIVSMMDQLIKSSGYTDMEKTKMLDYVIKHFEHKVITEDALANAVKQ